MTGLTIQGHWYKLVNGIVVISNAAFLFSHWYYNAPFICSFLQVYDNPLETYFGNFEDIATMYPLFRGKGQRNANSTERIVGRLKVRCRM